MSQILPPDATADEGTTNQERASWAETALLAFGRRTGTIKQVVGDADDPFQILSDLMADIAHWCDRSNVNLPSALEHATWHYLAETGGEGTQLG
jgi:hypothetical protein